MNPFKLKQNERDAGVDLMRVIMLRTSSRLAEIFSMGEYEVKEAYENKIVLAPGEFKIYAEHLFVPPGGWTYLLLPMPDRWDRQQLVSQIRPNGWSVHDCGDSTAVAAAPEIRQRIFSAAEKIMSELTTPEAAMNIIDKSERDLEEPGLSRMG